MARISGRRDVLLSVVVVVLVASFGALCWWQVTRALGGNTLSWAYVFEWPLFAGYVLYMWWRLSGERTTDETMAPQAGPLAAATAGAEEDDEELAAYNRYLASLEESGRAKRW